MRSSIRYSDWTRKESAIGMKNTRLSRISRKKTWPSAHKEIVPFPKSTTTFWTRPLRELLQSFRVAFRLLTLPSRGNLKCSYTIWFSSHMQLIPTTTSETWLNPIKIQVGHKPTMICPAFDNFKSWKSTGCTMWPQPSSTIEATESLHKVSFQEYWTTANYQAWPSTARSTSRRLSSRMSSSTP